MDFQHVYSRLALLALISLALLVASSPHVQGKPKRGAVAKKAAVKKTAKVAVNTSAKRFNATKIAKVANAKTSAKVVNMPLFGPSYSRVLVKDQKLSGAVLYLTPGHGGPDPGAIGQFGAHFLAEDEYAYDVTLRLARVLTEHGAKVYMTVQDNNDGIRDGKVLKLDHDEVAYPRQPIPLNQLARLKQGTDAVNRLHQQHKGAYQRMVTIHVDSRSKGQNIDVFFYHHGQSKPGKRLAKNIHRSFHSRYKHNQPGRAYLGNVSERGSLYVVRNTHPPTVFIELGNIRNEKDQRRFLIANNRQALANWIYEGILNDYRAD